jgi:hypothetical protein
MLFLLLENVGSDFFCKPTRCQLESRTDICRLLVALNQHIQTQVPNDWVSDLVQPPAALVSLVRLHAHAC